MFIERTLEKYLVDASRQFPVLMVVGARQVGITTLLQHISQKDRNYATLDDPLLAALVKRRTCSFLAAV